MTCNQRIATELRFCFLGSATAVLGVSLRWHSARGGCYEQDQCAFESMEEEFRSSRLPDHDSSRKISIRSFETTPAATGKLSLTVGYPGSARLQRSESSRYSQAEGIQ